MIARVWTARTTPAQASGYAEHLRAHVLPALRQVSGYAGMKFLQRTLPGAVEVVVVTFWQSMEAVRRFAGDDPERAVVVEEAAALLTDFDRRVRHYEVVAQDGPGD